MTATAVRRYAKYGVYGVLGLTALVAILLAWGSLVEPRLLDVERETAALPHLPPGWDGRTIALLADLQVGMWLANTGTARRAVRRLVAERPAAVLIAGDFLYKADREAAQQIAEAVGIVRPLPAAGIPTFAVLGNHDFSLDEDDDTKNAAMADALRRALEAAGVRVLHNEAARLTLPGGAGEALYLVGIGSRWAGEDDPARAVAEVPAGAARVVVMHNPGSFEALPPGTAPVALAAHTHGGQVRLPFTPEWSWLTFVREEEVHADGWVRDEGFGAPGNRLYVNRGIGFSDVPVRINCRPELTILRLRRQ